MRTLLCTLALSTLLAPALSAQAAGNPKLQWGPAPAVFPAGAQMAVVSGDPGKAGMFTIQLSMPAGYEIQPHWHPSAEQVQVKSGTLMVGMGDTFDKKSMKPMAVGDTGTIPAKMNHYAAAKGATVISVTAMGPFAMTYVNPKDTPPAPKPTP
jgi:quercetin dioxygenase-like cupin family protein